MLYLPEPEEKAHRRRKFCNAACKQRFYRKHRSERKQYEHTPFWKEQSDFWKALYEEAKEELDKERRYGDLLRDLLAWSQKHLEDIQEKQEWIEARLSAVEKLLHIEPVSPEVERILQECEEESKKLHDKAFRNSTQELHALIEATYQELYDRIHNSVFGDS